MKVSDIIANSSYQQAVDASQLTTKMQDMSGDGSNLKINVIKKGPNDQFPVITAINMDTSAAQTFDANLGPGQLIIEETL